MKNNQLTAIFLALFFLSTAANVWVIYKYNSTFKEAQRVQTSLMGFNVIQSLFNETAEYAKTHPDMQRVLQSPTSTMPAAPARSATGAAPRTNH